MAKEYRPVVPDFTWLKEREVIERLEGVELIEREIIKWEEEPDYVNGEFVPMQDTSRKPKRAMILEKGLDPAYGISPRNRRH